MAAKGHGDVEFLVNDLQRFGYAGLAHGAQAVHHGAANVAAGSAQRTGLEDILPATDAAVHVNFNLVSDGRHDGR